MPTIHPSLLPLINPKLVRLSGWGLAPASITLWRTNGNLIRVNGNILRKP